MIRFVVAMVAAPAWAWTATCGAIRMVSPRCPDPLAGLSFAEQVDASLKWKFNPKDIHRVLGSWRMMARGEVRRGPISLSGHDNSDPFMRQEADSFIDNLPIVLFYEPLQYVWAAQLEAEADLVLQEFLEVTGDSSLESRGNNVWIDAGAGGVEDPNALAYGPEWRTLALQVRGVWDPVNVALFPKTVDLLRRVGAPTVEIFFAKMPAGSVINPHSDGCNFHLTSHLGLVVPEGQCWLKVGDQKRYWQNGKMMLFDTSVIHAAENEALTDRYVLMLRVWHPSLSSTEVEAINWIFNCLDEPELLQTALEEAATSKGKDRRKSRQRKALRSR
eukprot:CAMPEP_0119333556 /NCGR_PEP_ID=MMETSP1333-20130426/85420_1 /TAXON_ID=418940 /ORGANISM="Scyphosphaera apsteinii, Strain RCC1455" /LENGTH=330 /DNA_ID=CAMNT_0007343653 /DNA_START=26 /DNA_END=1018 /DNA_ORIENTATION=+